MPGTIYFILHISTSCNQWLGIHETAVVVLCFWTKRSVTSMHWPGKKKKKRKGQKAGCGWDVMRRGGLFSHIAVITPTFFWPANNPFFLLPRFWLQGKLIGAKLHISYG